MPPVTDTRQRLIDAACELFWERGYAATGLSDILTAAGARGGSLYHFFPTKDDLLLAVVDQHSRVLESTIENALAAETEPEDKVLAVVWFYRRFMARTGFALGCPLTNLAGEIGDTHRAAADRIAGFNARLAERVAVCMGGVGPARAGDVRKESARAIVAMIQGATLQARAAKGPSPLDACATAVRAMLGTPIPTPVRVPEFAHA